MLELLLLLQCRRTRQAELKSCVTAKETVLTCWWVILLFIGSGLIVSQLKLLAGHSGRMDFVEICGVWLS